MILTVKFAPDPHPLLKVAARGEEVVDETHDSGLELWEGCQLTQLPD